ncbi:low affinity iron permease family protein [Sphingomonas sp. ID1715]|uniref:low affinity iron permease family protein n=1 Tax=Sphingomonas sp. ID1715 TaxID=1656898 RepID=UPI0014887695|nr:low affinity iron permease family protein [Sphingomonas sp. ID1715]NNM77330.1 low affinity iron permease family protein [Sphingomonas sp. ID1715]
MDRFFTRLATRIATISGQPQTFVLCMFLILVWAVTGPYFNFSDTWQLLVNTITTIVTFLMVFLIQNSQNRDAGAMQAKLDELIRSIDSAREQFIGIEHLTDNEIAQIRDALEREVSDASDKQATADDSVDRLLRRHYLRRLLNSRS